MEGIREAIAARRAQTDASLSAERADADYPAIISARATQRAIDDRLERDRLAADERLSKLRQGLDGALALLRSKTVSRSSVVSERELDEAKAEAREASDTLIAGERQRSDDAVAARRAEHEAHDDRLAAHRHDTDALLATERRADDAELGESKTALAAAKSRGAWSDDVFAMVTHDLRVPVTVLSMNAECIADHSTDEGAREAAQDMILAAARMDRLLRDLLDAVLIESRTLGSSNSRTRWALW